MKTLNFVERAAVGLECTLTAKQNLHPLELLLEKVSKSSVFRILAFQGRSDTTPKEAEVTIFRNDTD